MDPPDGTRLTENGREAVIKIELNGGWKWFSESPGDAKARLSAEAKQIIEREIDRIAHAMEQEGYIFPPSRDEEMKHLRWLYRRVTKRVSCRDIAQSEGHDTSSEYVQKVTKARADEMGITIPRPRVGRRGYSHVKPTI